MNQMNQNYSLDQLSSSGDFEFVNSSEYPVFNYESWLKLANCSFEEVRSDINLENFDIFTNPPFTSDNTNEIEPEMVPYPRKKGKNRGKRPTKNSLSNKDVKLEQNY
jgi:hypothetical protein